MHVPESSALDLRSPSIVLMRLDIRLTETRILLVETCVLLAEIALQCR